MKSSLFLCLVGAAAPLLAAPAGDKPASLVRRASDPSLAVPNRFIVLLKPDASAADVAAHHAHVRRMAKRDGAAGSAGIDRVFHIGSEFNGYVGDFDDATADEVARMPGVASVEQDFLVKVPTTLPGPAVEARAPTTQAGAPWHLGDVSHRERGAKDYVFDDKAGEGSYVYIVDTGIRTSHVEFGGRVRFGINGLTGTTDQRGDTNGHGTHCAGLAAGSVYGVAKKSNIVDIKVFGDNGWGSVSSIVTGVDWSVNDIVSRNIQNKTVISMSLAAIGTSAAMEAATIAAYNKGITPLCAAGNEDRPAAGFTPARLPQCITVGMSDSARNRAIPIPGVFGSNYGPELDIFAPGHQVSAAGIKSDVEIIANSGTSMATPVVAGMIAYLRSVETGLDTPEQVRSRLIDLSLKGVVGETRGSPSRLVNNNSGR